MVAVSLSSSLQQLAWFLLVLAVLQCAASGFPHNQDPFEDTLVVRDLKRGMDLFSDLNAAVETNATLGSAGRLAGERLLLEEYPAYDFIEPIPGVFMANRTVFVASEGGSHNTSSCGTLAEPCATLFQALGLSNSVVLLPGEHIVNGTVAVRLRVSVTIAGLIGDGDTRPSLSLDAGVDDGPLLFVLACGRFDIDSVAVTDWMCTDALRCVASAVDVRFCAATTVSNCEFLRNSKLLNDVGGLFRGTCLAVVSYDGVVDITGTVFDQNTFKVTSPTEVSYFPGGVITIVANTTIRNTTVRNSYLGLRNFAAQRLVFGYGTVFTFGSVELDGLVFATNYLSCAGYSCSSYGGGLYATSSDHTFTLVNSTFYENGATAANPGSTLGGAIFIEAEIVLIEGCRFSRNFVTAGQLQGQPLLGGAVYVHVGFFVAVRRSTFSDNFIEVSSSSVSVAGAGGALCVSSDTKSSATLEIDHCLFLGNFIGPLDGSIGQAGCSSFGGAVYAYCGLTATSTTFFSNSVTSGDSSVSVAPAAGGAVVQYKTRVATQFHNCTFEGNAAIGGRGTQAVRAVYAGAALVSGKVEFDSCEFRLNNVTGGSTDVSTSRAVPSLPGGSALGGALVLLSTDATIANCNFESNSAIGGSSSKGDSGTSGAGALAMSESIVRMSLCWFTENAAFSGEGTWGTLFGGAVVVDHSSLSLRDSILTGNFLSGGAFGGRGSAFGGSVAVLLPSFMSTSSSVVTHNYALAARAFGGAVFASGHTDWHSVRFRDNSCHAIVDGYGGAFAVYVARIILQDSNVQGNHADTISGFTCGGAVYATSDRYVYSSTSAFDGNYAGFGGAMCLWSYDGARHGSGTVKGLFYNNTALALGGVVYIHEDTALHCQVNGTGNTASCGTDCASAPVAAVPVVAPPQSLWPGQPQNLKIGLVDSFQQVCPRAFYMAQAVASGDTVIQTSAPQDTVTASDAGLFVFPNLQVFGGIGSSHIVGSTVYTNTPFDRFPSFEWNGRFSLLNCPPGHFFTANSTCVPCDVTSYNFDGTTCDKCPLEDQACISFANKVGTLFRILPGYYPTAFVDPVGLDACPVATSCIGYNCTLSPSGIGSSWTVDCSNCGSGDDGLDCMCAPGYTGRLCSDCVFTEDRCFFRTNGKCVDSESLPLGLWGPALQLTAYIVVTVAFFSLRQDAEKGTMKTFVFFVQTTAAFSSGVLFPYGAINLFASMTSGMILNWLNVAALRCLSYSLFSNQAVVMAILALLPYLVFFPLVILVHAVRLTIVYEWHRRKPSLPMTESLVHLLSVNSSPPRSPSSSPGSSPSSSRSSSPVRSPRSPDIAKFRKRFVDDCVHSALYIQYAAFFNTCNILFVSWGCEQQDSTGIWYCALFSGHLADLAAINMPWIQCGQGAWLQMLVVSILLTCLCVVLPAVIFATVLYRNRVHLDDPQVLRRYGFLYGSYKTHLYWWELLALLRRLALSFGLSAFVKGEALYYCFPVAVHLVSAAMQMQFQPLHAKRENMVELLAMFACIFSFEAGHQIDSFASLDDFDKWFVEIVVSLVNGAMLLVLLGFIVVELKNEYKDRAKRVYGRLRAVTSHVHALATDAATL